LWIRLRVDLIQHSKLQLYSDQVHTQSYPQAVHN